MIHTDRKDVITRTEALCRAFGWQGGTIHQVAEKTGCDSTDLIYSKDEPYIDQSHASGWFAYRTCPLDHNQQFIEKYKGNLQFWLGVASGVQTCIKMKQETPRKF